MPKTFSVLLLVLWHGHADAQSLGAGTLKGAVTDPSNAPIASAEVELKNPITGYSRQARTTNDGKFEISNIPPNRYKLYVSFAGFQAHSADVSILSAVPVSMTVPLE